MPQERKRAISCPQNVHDIMSIINVKIYKERMYMNIILIIIWRSRVNEYIFHACHKIKRKLPGPDHFLSTN